MNKELQEPTEQLLACFFTECESQFRFLEQKYGFTYLSGLVEYRGGRQIIQPYQNQAVEPPFQAVTRYEKDDVCLEITYGDKEQVLEPYVYFGTIYRLAAAEILMARRARAMII